MIVSGAWNFIDEDLDCLLIGAQLFVDASGGYLCRDPSGGGPDRRSRQRQRQVAPEHHQDEPEG